MSTEDIGQVARYVPGDVVRVRREPSLSVVVLPTHRACEASQNAPDLGLLCCVPIALVRTPVGDEPLRWVEISDLTHASGSGAEESPVPP
ncbi:hypothetical protein [Catenulispora pinisilvae]|uniref:hypothetical protein n=1 Tax=Catenulispora pinisilvae TaxID=2705253 RepID=UPI0018927877|nr:hypothetical protein [Catenulispora pinisilvae]